MYLNVEVDVAELRKALKKTGNDCGQLKEAYREAAETLHREHVVRLPRKSGVMAAGAYGKGLQTRGEVGIKGVVYANIQELGGHVGWVSEGRKEQMASRHVRYGTKLIEYSYAMRDVWMIKNRARRVPLAPGGLGNIRMMSHALITVKARRPRGYFLGPAAEAKMPEILSVFRDRIMAIVHHNFPAAEVSRGD